MVKYIRVKELIHLPWCDHVKVVVHDAIHLLTLSFAINMTKYMFTIPCFFFSGNCKFLNWWMNLWLVNAASWNDCLTTWFWGLGFDLINRYEIYVSPMIIFIYIYIQIPTCFPPLMEKELTESPRFNRVRVAQSVVFCV